MILVLPFFLNIWEHTINMTLKKEGPRLPIWKTPKGGKSHWKLAITLTMASSSSKQKKVKFVDPPQPPPLVPVEQTKGTNGLDKVILRVPSGFTTEVFFCICIAFFHISWILAKNQHTLFYMTNKIYPQKIK